MGGGNRSPPPVPVGDVMVCAAGLVSMGCVVLSAILAAPDSIGSADDKNQVNASAAGWAELTDKIVWRLSYSRSPAVHLKDFDERYKVLMR